MTPPKKRPDGLTLTELMMVSFVMSIVMICLFRAITLFTQGAMQIQRVLPAQRALQTAAHMVSVDLLSSSRATINNLLRNPGFEDFSGELTVSATPSTSAWSFPPSRMKDTYQAGYYFVRIQSALWPMGKRCLAISSYASRGTAISPAVGPAVKVENFMVSASLKGDGVTTADVEVRGGLSAVAPATLLRALHSPSPIDWNLKSSSFTTTLGHYYQVTLISDAEDKSIAGFDNVYLGPLSVEVSTSNPTGKLFMLRSNAAGERERVEYTMSIGAGGVGRLVRKRTRSSGAEEVTTIDGIDSLIVSWLGAPSAVGGTDRALVVQLVGRGMNSKPTDALSMQFEVYPNVP